MTMRSNENEMIVDGQVCNDENRTALPKNPVVAMAYVPYQQFNASNLYGSEEAFRQGTLFPDLDKPFSGWPGDWK